MPKNKTKLNRKNGTVKDTILPAFTRNIVFQRWTVLIVMSLLLAVLLSPEIHIITPKYKLESIATKDVKADSDFLVEDKVSTEQKKAEAVKRAKPIYDLDRYMPSRIGMTMSKAFLGMAEVYNRVDREKLQPDTAKAIIKEARSEIENIIGLPLTDSEFKAFSSYKFPIDICNNNVKLIYSVYNEGIISREDFSGISTDNGIIIRNIKNQSEQEKYDLASILSLKTAYSHIEKNALFILEDEERNVRNASISLVKRILQPNLTFAKNATEQRKELIRNSVKPVFYKVQKNEMIVREGEKITSVHLDKLAALYAGYEGSGFLNISIFTGLFLAITLFSLILYYVFTSQIATRLKHINTDILLIGIAAILQVLLARIGIFICDSIYHAFPLIPAGACMYAVPFSTAAMLVVVLINREAGILFAVFSSFLISFLFEEKASMFFFSLLGSMVAAFKIYECKERSAFFKTGVIVGFVNMGVIVCLSLLVGRLFSMETLINIVMGASGGFFAAAVAISIIPLFEFVFGYTTDIKLLELANLNQPVFQQMIMVAPGTYHHSVVVASMVETAADAIGANSLLAKVSAYYHDIGKLKKALYFIENQKGPENKLDKLSPKMSSLVVISHVKEGVELAKDYKLGKAIIDVIRQHHGTRLVGYFYEKAQKNKDPSVRAIPEGDFRYPGPKPQSKEAGLVLLGDVVEASSRTLKNPTPSRIKSLVEDRINQVLMEGELNESDLTLNDLNKIAESFTRTLNGIFHQRIDYPEPVVRENNGKKENNGDSYRKPSEKNKVRPSKSSASAH